MSSFNYSTTFSPSLLPSSSLVHVIRYSYHSSNVVQSCHQSLTMSPLRAESCPLPFLKVLERWGHAHLCLFEPSLSERPRSQRRVRAPPLRSWRWSLRAGGGSRFWSRPSCWPVFASSCSSCSRSSRSGAIALPWLLLAAGARLRVRGAPLWLPGFLGVLRELCSPWLL